MLITLTNIYAFCIWETQLVIVVELVFGYGYNPERSLLQKHVYTYTPISGPKESPDMICNAFAMTFMTNTTGYLPVPVDRPNTIQTNQTNALENWAPRPPTRGSMGAAASSSEKHSGVA